MSRQNEATHPALQWTGETLKLLDQRLLPQTIVYHEYSNAEDIAEAITSMCVRGAPLIGITAAYAVVLSVRQHYSETNHWRQKVLADIALLTKSRPTAVNLFWALDQMKTILNHQLDNPLLAVLECAEKIHADDCAANLKMGELGAELLNGAKGVLTHCNAGALATGGYGTALGVIRSSYKNHPLNVYAGETRPWLQGVRLTAWELAHDGIPVTVCTDSAAAWLMKSGAISWVVTGADRIAANGDTANKIGTYSLAVLARHHGVKFMVVAPTSTIDWSINNGNQIQIEQRDQNELLPECYLKESSPVSAWNPVFDVTPAELISVIVTERGVVSNPAGQGVRGLL
jgi:methylthioribose-1-phosphate isomerase